MTLQNNEEQKEEPCVLCHVLFEGKMGYCRRCDSWFCETCRTDYPARVRAFIERRVTERLADYLRSIVRKSNNEPKPEQ